MRYTNVVTYTVLSTYEFAAFLSEMRDAKAHMAIASRIERLQHGLLGEVRSVQGGVSELKVDVGPGYRVYFTIRNREIVILLCGGDKRTQSKDIKLAQKMAQDF